MPTDRCSAVPISPEFCPLAVDALRLTGLLSLGVRTIRTMEAAGKLPAPFPCGNRKLWGVSQVNA